MPYKAYVHTKARRADGTFDSYLTQEVPCKQTDQPRHGQTQTGYGGRIPTGHMIYWNGRWRRVYVAVWSNAGTAYIGKKLDVCLTVSIDAVETEQEVRTREAARIRIPK